MQHVGGIRHLLRRGLLLTQWKVMEVVGTPHGLSVPAII